jgi:hypothetical protein
VQKLNIPGVPKSGFGDVCSSVLFVGSRRHQALVTTSFDALFVIGSRRG